MELIPYLTFYGACEEALTFYQTVLGGDIEIVSRYDNPAMQAPADYRQKILHARYAFEGIMIYASDAYPGSKAGSEPGPVALSVGIKDPAVGQKLFDGLSAGGKVGVPYTKQFWGDWHGNFVDRFGVRWMLNATD